MGLNARLPPALTAALFLAAPGPAQDFTYPTEFFSEETIFAARVNFAALTSQAIGDTVTALIDLPALQRNLSGERRAQTTQQFSQMTTLAQGFTAAPQGLVMMGVPHLSIFGFRAAADGSALPRAYAMLPVPQGVDPARVQQGLSWLSARMPQTTVVSQYVDDTRTDEWLVASAMGAAMPPDTGWSPARMERFNEAAAALQGDEALFWTFIPDFHLRDAGLAALNAAGSSGQQMSARDIALRAEARTLVDTLGRARWIGGTVRLGGNFLLTARAELSDPAHVTQVQNAWNVCTGIALEAARSQDAARARQNLPPMTYPLEQVATAAFAAFQPEYADTGIRIDLTGAELRSLIPMIAISVSESIGEAVAGAAVAPFAALLGE